MTSDTFYSDGVTAMQPTLSKELPMSHESKALTLIPEVTVQTGFDKNDIIAIATSEYEESATLADQNLDKQLAALAQEQLDLKEQVTKEVQRTAEAGVKEQVKNLLAGFRGFREWRRAMARVQGSLRGDRVQATVNVYESETSYKQQRYGALGVSTQLPLSKALKSLLKETEAVEARVKQVTEQKLRIRQSLNQIGRVERNARATMARHALEQSAEGRAILAQVRSVKQLPGMVDLSK